MNRYCSRALVAGGICLLYLSSTEKSWCEPGDEVVTICDLMADPGAFQGRIIALRARVRSSREWSALVTSEPCTKPPRSDLQVWPPEVTVGTLKWLERKTGIRPFERTQEEVAAEAKYSELFWALKPGETVEATFVGYVRTRERYEAKQLPNGRWVPANGFGHLGAYFAELTLKTTRDVRIVSVE